MRNATTLPPAPSPTSPLHSSPPPPTAMPSVTGDDRATVNSPKTCEVTTATRSSPSNAAGVAKDANLLSVPAKQVYRPPAHRSSNITPYVPAGRKPLDDKQSVQDSNNTTSGSQADHSAVAAAANTTTTSIN